MMAALQVLDGELWQWDTGREVEVVGCEQVHFAKSTTGTCYTVAVANSKAKIPDELLQAAGRVYAWAYITDEAYGGRTRIEALWDVKRRAKPAEYIYEPSDQRIDKSFCYYCVHKYHQFYYTLYFVIWLNFLSVIV